MMNLFPQIRSFLMKKALLLLFSLTLAFPSSVLAQATSSLRGQVLDPSGAVVPGAAVTLTEGPAVLNVQSGNDGVYTFKSIPPGSYTLTVQANGFADFSKTGIVVAAGQTRPAGCGPPRQPARSRGPAAGSRTAVHKPATWRPAAGRWHSAAGRDGRGDLAAAGRPGGGRRRWRAGQQPGQ